MPKPVDSYSRNTLTPHVHGHVHGHMDTLDDLNVNAHIGRVSPNLVLPSLPVAISTPSSQGQGRNDVRPLSASPTRPQAFTRLSSTPSPVTSSTVSNARRNRLSGSGLRTQKDEFRLSNSHVRPRSGSAVLTTGTRLPAVVRTNSATEMSYTPQQGGSSDMSSVMGAWGVLYSGEKPNRSHSKQDSPLETQAKSLSRSNLLHTKSQSHSKLETMDDIRRRKGRSSPVVLNTSTATASSVPVSVRHGNQRSFNLELSRDGEGEGEGEVEHMLNHAASSHNHRRVQEEEDDEEVPLSMSVPVIVADNHDHDDDDDILNMKSTPTVLRSSVSHHIDINTNLHDDGDGGGIDMDMNMRTSTSVSIESQSGAVKNKNKSGLDGNSNRDVDEAEAEAVLSSWGSHAITISELPSQSHSYGYGYHRVSGSGRGYHKFKYDLGLDVEIDGGNSSGNGSDIQSENSGFGFGSHTHTHTDSSGKGKGKDNDDVADVISSWGVYSPGADENAFQFHTQKMEEDGKSKSRLQLKNQSQTQRQRLAPILNKTETSYTYNTNTETEVSVSVSLQIQDSIEHSLDLLRSECKSSYDLVSALHTLSIYVDNIVSFPSDVQYRRIRMNNANFMNLVARWRGGIEFLIACGFEKDEKENVLNYTNTDDDEGGAILRFAHDTLESLIYGVVENELGIDIRKIEREMEREKDVEGGGGGRGRGRGSGREDVSQLISTIKHRKVGRRSVALGVILQEVSQRLSLISPSHSIVVENRSLVYSVGISETVGRRPTMEDRMLIYGQFNGVHGDLFAVFDGHGGSDCSDIAARLMPSIIKRELEKERGKEKGKGGIESALKNAFIDMHRVIADKDLGGGTTACLALFSGDGDGVGYVANVGDTRAVLAKKGLPAVRLSVDHKPDLPEEEARISKNGFVTRIKLGNTSVARVNGTLAVSRALGDTYLHPMVSSIPHVAKFRLKKRGESEGEGVRVGGSNTMLKSPSHEIQPSSTLSPSLTRSITTYEPVDDLTGGLSIAQEVGDCLIMACDGVFDVVSDQEVATCALSCLALNQTPTEAATKIRDLAYNRGSFDNISVLVLFNK